MRTARRTTVDDKVAHQSAATTGNRLAGLWTQPRRELPPSPAFFTIGARVRAATAGLGQWLEQDYSLTPSEIAIVLGSSVEYAIGEVADRNAGVAAKLKKDRLTFNR